MSSDSIALRFQLRRLLSIVLFLSLFSYIPCNTHDIDSRKIDIKCIQIQKFLSIMAN